MEGPPSAEDAFATLASGGLRELPLEAIDLVETAWPELERWVAVFLRAVGAGPEIREDCGQEVLLRVWRTRASYRGGSRGELLAWLYRICQREHHRLLERRGRAPRPHTEHEPEVDDDPDETRGASIVDPTVETAEKRESLHALSECIRELDPDSRRVVELLYSASAPTEREVAVVIDVSKSQVNVLRRRALGSLAACLRRKGVEA